MNADGMHNMCGHLRDLWLTSLAFAISPDVVAVRVSAPRAAHRLDLVHQAQHQVHQDQVQVPSPGPPGPPGPGPPGPRAP